MSGSASRSAALRLLLTGGGTGGHLFPAIATAEQVRVTLPGSAVLFVGTTRRLDRDSLSRHGFAVKTIHCHGLKGKNTLELVKALLVLPLSLLESCYHILSFRPDVVLGVGGYVTGPVVVASWLLRRPTLIHEQNSIPGLANRKLGRLVDRICLSLPQSAGFFPVAKTVLTGNPVRRAIVEAGSSPAPAGAKPTLLVLGGSQGAHAVNEMMVEAVGAQRRRFAGVRVIHQTGREDEEMVARAYRDCGIDHLVAAFFTDMAGLYREAQLIVSRAGATTLAEIAVVGRAAVLIPYPHAADNHQEKNGSWYVDGGAALMLPQRDLTAERLAGEILALLEDRERLERMSAAMKKLGIGDAAERIVEICLELARK